MTKRDWLIEVLFWLGGFCIGAGVMGFRPIVRVQADTTCPVVSAVAKPDGSTAVTFDCKAYTFVITEPKWP